MAGKESDKPLKISVLVLLLRERKGKTEVCLGMKKIGYGKGRWNGFGGKAGEEESLEDAAIRELEEESEVKTRSGCLKKVAELMYYETEANWKVNVFICRKWSGEVKETGEMEPRWFSLDNLPLKDMWENDALWMPVVLSSNKKMKGTIWHDENDKVVRHELRFVRSL
jgi:8-oxo-dGTP pyrophosphatase MutT (NUDIX family)